MRFDIPVDCPAHEIKHFTFFVKIDISKKGPLQARAFLGCHQEVELHPVFPHGEGHEIPCPFSGFLSFQLREHGQLEEAKQCTLEILLPDEQIGIAATLYAVWVLCERRHLYLPCETVTKTEGVEHTTWETDEPASVPFLSLDHVETISGDVDLVNGSVCFQNTQPDSNEYIFLYCCLGKQEVYNETECSLFLPKNHYLSGEPIVATYRNLYDKYDVNKFFIDLMFYREGDRPGIDKSRDCITLKFCDYNRGSSGSAVFPADGARKYKDYLPGRYSAHLMQRYENICPTQYYTVSAEPKEDALNAPPPGNCYFIKADCLPAQVTIRMNAPKRLILWRFSCTSPVLGDFEQRLYRMTDVAAHIDGITKCNEIAAHVRESVIIQFLQTAYVREKLHRARYTKGDIPEELCRQMIVFIEDNLCNNINIGMMMEAFHCSESFISHYFKKNMHISFSSYIYRAKMAKAKQWLVEGEKTVSEIAELLNYSDVQAFSHAFRRLTGETPTAYREVRSKKK